MNEGPSIETVAGRAEALRGLHGGPGMLVLPNAWDAASAQVFEKAGFEAIATTSGGVAAALGYKDHEDAPVEEMLAAAGRIIRSVSVPVTVDFEAGYGLTPREIAERLVSIGAAGLNLEDSDHHGAAALVDAEKQAERLAAVKAAVRGLGADLVLNARVDVFIHRLGTPDEQLSEGLRRARLYRQAGADCIYPIILSDEAMLSALVEAAGVVNATVRRGGPLSLKRAAAIGVRRVTYATSIFREAMTALEGIADDIQSQAGEIRAETRV
jgi:2-methylisocitrate lyase-like PEP mutase family enzyme